MHRYNHHFPDDATPDSLGKDRAEMLGGIFGHIGTGAYIEPPINIDYGSNIIIGDNFYSNFKYVRQEGALPVLPFSPPFSRARPLSRGEEILTFSVHANTHHQPPPLLLRSLVILDCAIVTIGNRVMFGPFVSIFAATHETEVQSRREGIEYARPVTIGDDCWVGGNVTIMPGVTIGKGCTIGAGSVVTRDVPDFSVAMGSPARVVKRVTPVPDP